MRWLVFVAVMVMGSFAFAGAQSNPAFMGIGMSPAPGGCEVDKVTKGSAAATAGLESGDVILAIDGTQLPVWNAAAQTTPCDALKNQILSHPPGDVVRLDITRDFSHVVVKVELTTRAEVLHQRFMTRAMEPAEVIDVDDVTRTYDLTAHGHTTVVGWFMLDHCSGCGHVFERVADAVTRRLHQKAQIVAITNRGHNADTALMRKAFSVGMPLAMVDDETFDDLAIDDPERVFFMVIDCHGIVRFVAPVAPDADDIDAAIDEVLAAAEQAEHARISRR